VHVLGNPEGELRGPVGHVGAYRARDGSLGEAVGLDLGGPHAACVVGKRGSGKTYTLGVLAEELAAVGGIAPIVVDPMGAFRPVGDDDALPASVSRPAVEAGALDPRSWCALFGLEPTSAAGALLWRAAADAETLAGMRSFVEAADASETARRAAANHLDLAASWGVFDADAPPLFGSEVTVLDCAGLARAPMHAVCRTVADACYRARVGDTTRRLPWLLVDEAHEFFDGIAAPALRRLLTRGRGPGVSLVVATQRPSALPGVAVSQTDLLVCHRLTGRADVEALRAARPTYVDGSLTDRLPERPGDALIVDDATERLHPVRIRERTTDHGGGSSRVEEG
jgi:hypothetical protein